MSLLIPIPIRKDNRLYYNYIKTYDEKLIKKYNEEAKKLNK